MSMYVWGVRVWADVWDELSEYLPESRVLTSADFNMYPIRIFVMNSRYLFRLKIYVFFNVCTIELLLPGIFTSALIYHFQPYVLWSVASSWGLASVALTKKDAQCLCLAIPCLSQLWVDWYSFLDFLLAMELNRLVTAYLYIVYSI